MIGDDSDRLRAIMIRSNDATHPATRNWLTAMATSDHPLAERAHAALVGEVTVAEALAEIDAYEDEQARRASWTAWTEETPHDEILAAAGLSDVDVTALINPPLAQQGFSAEILALFEEYGVGPDPDPDALSQLQGEVRRLPG